MKERIAIFTDLNTRLIKVKDDIRKKAKYEDHLERLNANLYQGEMKKDKLEQQLIKKKEDVTRLENFSLTNIFFTIIGKKLEKLDNEQQELLAAKLKYTEALETIEDIEGEINQFHEKLLLVANAENEYEEILKEKERLIHDNHSFWSETLYALTDKEADIYASLTEYDEAISVGKQAVQSLKEALDSLTSAQNWSTFDMFGGGIISTSVKHNRFDAAKSHIHHAQSLLRQFQEELLDIDKHFHSNFETGELLTFADYFFDGIIADWIVHGKINDCFQQTEKAKSYVSKILQQIIEQKNDLETDLINIHAERIKIFESSK